MIKAVGINDSVRLRALGNAKNGHADNINVIREQNSVVNVEEKSMLLSSFLQPQKSVSFKAIVHEKTPDDWVEQLGGIIEKGGVEPEYNYYYNHSYDPSIPPKPSAKDLIEKKENQGKIFSFSTVYYECGEFGSPKFKKPMDYGYIYVNGDGKLTELSFKEIDINKKYPNVAEDNKEQIIREQLIPIYEASGNIQEINELFERNKFYDPSNVSKQIDYFIAEGRSEEAVELYPDLEDMIKSKEEKIKKINCSPRQNGEIDEFETFLLNGDIENILALKKDYKYGYPIGFKYADKLPESVREMSHKELKQTINIFKDKNFLTTLIEKKKKEAKAQALKESLAIEGNKQDRIITALATFGISEVVYQYRLYMEEQPNTVHEYNSQIKIISDLTMMISEAKQKHNIETKTIEDRSIVFAEKRQVTKDKIKKGFLTPLDKYKKNSNIFIPNCIMLYGDNTSLMKDIIFDVKNMAKANFVEVKSQRSNDNMQEELFEQLEQAEDHYQKTKERSIIFVNGMDKLLNPKLNSQENIACMKDFMSSANEDYHSTIIFYSRQPEKLDAGTLMSHRVNMSIKVPVELITE